MILCAFLAGVVPVLPGLSTQALAADAATFGAADAEPSIPAVLGALDASRYAAIFALQEEGSWKPADAEIVLLKDKVLLGEVLAQRYTDPHYHTSFAEARDWLEQYADLPEARAIWTLAKKHAPAKAALPAPQPASTQAEVSPADSAVVRAAAAEDFGSGTTLPAEPRSIGLEAPPRFQAGLAAWRMKNWAAAVSDFEAVAKAPGTASW